MTILGAYPKVFEYYSLYRRFRAAPIKTKAPVLIIILRQEPLFFNALVLPAIGAQW